jgi:hypothetical protein
MADRRPAWLLALALAAAPASAQTPAPRYRFDAVGESTVRGVGVVLQVRAADLAGQPKAGISFVDPRIDHAPDGAASASFPAFPLPPREAGLYEFRTSIPVAGLWALRLQARVPGEPQPVFASVMFKMVDPPRRASYPSLAQDPAVRRAEPLSSTQPQKRTTDPF